MFSCSSWLSSMIDSIKPKLCIYVINEEREKKGKKYKINWIQFGKWIWKIINHTMVIIMIGGDSKWSTRIYYYFFWKQNQKMLIKSWIDLVFKTRIIFAVKMKMLLHSINIFLRQLEADWFGTKQIIRMKRLAIHYTYWLANGRLFIVYGCYRCFVFLMNRISWSIFLFLRFGALFSIANRFFFPSLFYF